MTEYHIFCGYGGDDHFEWYETVHDKEDAEQILKVEGKECEAISNRVILGDKIDISKVLNADIGVISNEDLNAYYLIKIIKKKRDINQYLFKEEEIYDGNEILEILNALGKRSLNKYILIHGRDLDIEANSPICTQTFEIHE